MLTHTKEQQCRRMKVRRTLEIRAKEQGSRLSKASYVTGLEKSQQARALAVSKPQLEADLSLGMA